MEKIINKIAAQQFNGESPIAVPGSNKVYFVDTGNPVCIELDTKSGSTIEHKLEENCQCIGRTESDGWISTTNEHILIFDNSFSILNKIDSPESGKAYMNLSDGTVGPDGCFYFGSMNNEDLFSKDGSIYRLNPDLTIEKILSGFALPNGIAFSNDGSRCYITEMFANCIWSFDFNSKTGELSNKTVFAEVPEEDGLPDGLIIDSEDFIYSAHWAGFRITRYSKDGSIERTMALPVPTPTCMAFGGEDKSVLFVTTARKALSEEELNKYPESGDLFVLKTDFIGRDELLFRV